MSEYDDFIIAAGPRHSGKTTELIKEVCRINRESGRNVAVIICWSHADAHCIARQADELGFPEMPYPITVAELRYNGCSRARGSFYKYGFVNDLDRIAQSLISPLCLQLRGFTYTIPESREET